jgi:uncharacterized protein (TIGR03382 family)
LLVLGLCALAGRCALATVAVMGTTSGSAGPAISTSFGPVVDAVNLGGSNVTVNSIAFTGLDVSGSVQTATLATTPFNVSVAAISGQTLGNASTGSDTLYETEIYTSNNTAETLTIGGLSTGTTYQIQFLHADGRNGVTYSSGTQTFTDSGGNNATTALTFNSSSANAFVDLTVQVSNSTSLTYAMPNAGRGPSFSGFVIEAVPETGTVTLAMLGGLALLVRRRRRSR